MTFFGFVLAIIVAAMITVAILWLALGIRVVKQYEMGVLFRLGQAVGTRGPGLHVTVPIIDRMHRVSLRLITMPITGLKLVTSDNISVRGSAVAYYRVVDAMKSFVHLSDTNAAVDHLTQSAIRKVVAQRTVQQLLVDVEGVSADIKTILDAATAEWGVQVISVELTDVELPAKSRRALAAPADEKRRHADPLLDGQAEPNGTTGTTAPSLSPVST